MLFIYKKVVQFVQVHMERITLIHRVYLVQQQLMQIQAVILMLVLDIIPKVLHLDIGTAQALHKHKVVNFN